MNPAAFRRPERRGRARVARAVVVVSADAQTRRDWADLFRGDVTHVLGCAGPLVSCALLDGRSCPLLEEADLAVYHTASLTPDVTRRLPRAHPYLPILFARDERGTDGRHHPVVVAAAGPIDRGGVAPVVPDEARIIPPPPRAISEEEAEQEIRESERSTAR